ncbi:hypothetical protein CRUP_007185, partial [Coryphaenoides rupestris]
VEALPANVSLRAVIEKAGGTFQKDRHPAPPCCPDHQGQPLNIYCVQDCKLICGLCLTVGQHRGHSIDDVQSAFIRERQTPAELLARLSDQRWAQVCELGVQLEQGKARCEGQVGADRLAVEQFFQGLELTLSKKKEAFLGALDTVSVTVSEAYDPLINRVKEMQEEQSVLVSLVSSMEEEDCPLVFLDQMHLFRRRVEALMDAPLPSASAHALQITPETATTRLRPQLLGVPSAVALSVSPRAADYLQRHWPVVTIGGLDEAPIPTVCCCGDPGAVQEAEPWNRLTAAVAAVWDPERIRRSPHLNMMPSENGSRLSTSSSSASPPSVGLHLSTLGFQQGDLFCEDVGVAQRLDFHRVFDLAAVFGDGGVDLLDTQPDAEGLLLQGVLLLLQRLDLLHHCLVLLLNLGQRRLQHTARRRR